LLEEVFARLEFETALDPFSGTGAVSYLLKAMGKQVTASDILEANAVTARALVQNQRATLDGELETLLEGLPDPDTSPGFIERTFDGIFFEREENRFLDGALERIGTLDGPRRDLALHALFQACLAKRPYNLFHRANLSMRRREVSRTFGNKTTWERPFPELIDRYSREVDRAVFDSGHPCRASRADVEEIDPGGFDLVYLDPPYVSAKGVGVDYLDYYHFLEGLVGPDGWEDRILTRYKHKPLRGRGESPWSDARRISGSFEAVIERFAGAILVVSYRSDGIPGIDVIADFMKRAGKRVEVVDAGAYTYALSRNRRSREVVLVGI
jgi:adenine-specific DNA methylase